MSDYGYGWMTFFSLFLSLSLFLFFSLLVHSFVLSFSTSLIKGTFLNNVLYTVLTLKPTALHSHIHTQSAIHSLLPMDPTTTTTTTTTTVDETRGKRNSAYIPVHRRRGNSISDNRVQDDKWIEEDEQAPKRQSMYSRASSSDIDSRRSSRQFAWSRQQQRFSLAAAAARYGDDTEDSDNDPLTPHQRFSRPDSRRNSTADKLHMALEGLSVHDEPDWEELLRQYDRYDDGPIGGVDSRRSSKRQSRIMDPFNEPARKSIHLLYTPPFN